MDKFSKQSECHFQSFVIYHLEHVADQTEHSVSSLLVLSPENIPLSKAINQVQITRLNE